MQLPAVLLSMSAQGNHSRRSHQHHGTNLIYGMVYANALFEGGSQQKDKSEYTLYFETTQDG